MIMLVFIDESGDAGFKTEKGSSSIFAAAMVVFSDNETALFTESVIREAYFRLNATPELKFNKSSNQVRDGFFDAVRNCPFNVRAIVVRKEIIYSHRLKAEKEEFYRFFVRQMMTHDDGMLDSAKVVIDGSGDRVFRRMLQSSLRRQLEGKLKKVRFSNSKTDFLVQLADMSVGAIARSYRPDRSNHDRWHKMLRPRINNVWEFR